MGGLTIRGVTDLLRDGSEAERAYHQAHPEAEEVSPLFVGGRDLVFSNTSIAHLIMAANMQMTKAVEQH